MPRRHATSRRTLSTHASSVFAMAGHRGVLQLRKGATIGTPLSRDFPHRGILAGRLTPSAPRRLEISRTTGFWPSERCHVSAPHHLGVFSYRGVFPTADLQAADFGATCRHLIISGVYPTAGFSTAGCSLEADIGVIISRFSAENPDVAVPGFSVENPGITVSGFGQNPDVFVSDIATTGFAEPRWYYHHRLGVFGRKPPHHHLGVCGNPVSLRGL